MARDHTYGTTANVGAEHQKRLMMSLGLTSTVFIAEVVSAIITGSLALLVDAGHMLTDMSVLICINRHRNTDATQTQQQTHLGMGAARSAHCGSRSPHTPHRRHLCTRGSRHETLRRVC